MSSYHQPDDNIRKAGLKIKYTPEQIEEIKKCANDVKYFCEKYCKVVGPNGTLKPFVLMDHQHEMLESYDKYDKVVSLISRQMGKTESTAVYLLHYGLFTKNQTILIVAHNLGAATEVLDRIKAHYENLPLWLQQGCILYNRRNVLFENKSRFVIRATKADSTRGLSVNILYCDEMSFVPSKIAKEFYASSLATLTATKGKMFITSTPLTQTDLFYEIWTGSKTFIDDNGLSMPSDGPGINGFKGIFANRRNRKDYSEEWERKERLSYNDDAKFDREHLCQFSGLSEALISNQYMGMIRSKVIKPIKIEGPLRWYKTIDPKKTYSISLDPSTGTGKDYAAIQVIEAETLTQVAEYMSKNAIPQEQLKVIKYIVDTIKDECMKGGNKEPEIYWSFENNSVGNSIISVLKERDDDFIDAELINQDYKRQGFHTSNSTKNYACLKFKSLLETGKFAVYSEEFVKQLASYVTSGVSFAARTGENDDLIASMLINIRMLEKLVNYSDEIEEVFTERSEDDDVPEYFIM